MSENQSFDLLSLIVYLTNFDEDSKFNQDFIVCMADRSTVDSKSSKLPRSRSKLPSYKPLATSEVPEKSRLPRKSVIHSDRSRLPTAKGSTVPISSSKVLPIKPVEVAVSGRPSKLVPPKITWHSILSTAESGKLFVPKDKSSSIPTRRPTVNSTQESSESQHLEEVGKIYMSMSMYLNSDSLRETLMDQVKDLSKPSSPDETTTTTSKKESRRSQFKETDARTKEILENVDSVEITSSNSRPPIVSAPYDIEKLRGDKWYEDYKTKRQRARKPPSSLQPIQETDEMSIEHNSPRRKTQPKYSPLKQTKPEVASSRPPNISVAQYHIDKLSKYLDSNSQLRTIIDQINDIFYSTTPEEKTITTTESPQSKLTDQRTEKGITNVESVKSANIHSSPPVISAPYDFEKERVKWKEDYKRKRQAVKKPPSSLQTIQEEAQEINVDSEERQVKKALDYEEELLRKKIEDELPNGLIYDTNRSILVACSSSSSKESFETELVIKAPPIREVIADVDDADLSIPERAILESNRLTEQIEAIKDKYYISVAKEKYKQSRKPMKRPEIRQKPTSSETTSSSQHLPIRNPFQDALNKKLRSDETVVVPKTAHSSVKSSIPVDLMDTHTWGAAALPKPISPHRDYSDTSEKLKTSSQRRLREITDLATIEDVNDFEDPQFTDLPSDESIQESSQQPEIVDSERTENINDLEDPQFTDLPSDESIQESSKQPEIVDFENTENISDLEDPQFTDLPSEESIHPIPEEPDVKSTQSPAAASERSTDPLEDMKRIKEFIMSGRQLKDVKDQSTIDLFMRCSESLINPVVRLEVLEKQSDTDELRVVIHEIPLSSFTYGKSYERGLLDESINENDLNEPLIKKPSKKIHNYFADFDELHDPRLDKVDVSVGEDDEDESHTLIFGLPKFSYEPVPLYRKKVHDIMDSEEEPEDSDDILEDDDMNIDSLVKEIAEPTYEFQSEPNFIEQSRARAKYYRYLVEKYRTERKPDLQNTTVPESEHLNDPVNMNQSREATKSTNPEILKRIFAKSCIDVNEMVDGCSVESILIPYFFDYPIIREVDNCSYHMRIVNLIYRKYEFCFEPSSEEDSPTEMHAKFNRILNGRICARLKSCPPRLPSHAPKAPVLSQNGSKKTLATATSSKIDRSSGRAAIKKYLERKIAEDSAADVMRRKVVEAEAEENAKRQIADAETSSEVRIALTEESQVPIKHQELEKQVKIKKLVSWADDDSTSKTSKDNKSTKKLKPIAKTKTPSGRSTSVTTTTVKTSKPVTMRAGKTSLGEGTAGTASSKKTIIMTSTTTTTTSANTEKK